MTNSSSPIPAPMLEQLRSQLQITIKTLSNLENQLPDVMRLGEVIVSSLVSGGTLFTAGNGGSAAQALHLTEELIGRYERNRPPIRSISLVSDPTAMTCIANDFGYETIFERPLQGLGRQGDVLLVMSTSGKSQNILRVLDAARTMGITTMGLLGRDGGPALAACDHSLVIDADRSATIQDAHQVVIHHLCELIESGIVDR